jgi:hypothetical protein
LPDRNIDNMVLRVGKIEEGDTGVLTLTVVQDVFGLPSTSYSSGQQERLDAPDKTARPVSVQRLIELPYAVLAGTLSEAELSYLKPESGYPGVMAVARRHSASTISCRPAQRERRSPTVARGLDAIRNADGSCRATRYRPACQHGHLPGRW